MCDGAVLAADKLGFELALIDENCEPGSGPAIARQVRDSGAKAAMGFLCSESSWTARSPRSRTPRSRRSRFRCAGRA